MTVRAFPRPGMYHLPFLDARSETPTAMTFRFGIEGRGFRYLPNQFVGLGLHGVEDPWGPVRRFSLSSSPTETDAIAITSKMTGSPYKEALKALAPGEFVEVRGPIGDFVLDEDRPAVMVAGGIGITPFRGMIRYAADSRLRHPIVLVYSARTPEEFAFRGELDRLAEDWRELRTHYTITRPAQSEAPWDGRIGRIDASLLREATAGLDAPVWYVCGLPRMVNDVGLRLVRELSVPVEDIKVERFMGY